MDFIAKQSKNGKEIKTIESNSRYRFVFYGNPHEAIPERMELIDLNSYSVVLSLSEEDDIFVHKHDHEGRLVEKRNLDGTRTIRYYYNDEGKLVKSVDVMETDDDFPLVTVKKYKDGEVVSSRTFVPDTEEIVED